MTSRKRVKYALNHKEPDRVPIHDNVWDTTVERRREGGFLANFENDC